MLKKVMTAFWVSAPLLAQGTTSSDDPDVFNPMPVINSIESQIPTSGRGKGGSVKPQAWPSDKTFVEDKSLPFDIGTPGYGDLPEANARVCYAFQVAPGEKMEFNLKGEGEKVVMRVYVPNPPPALKWKLQLDYVNRIARPRRSKHIELKNTTSQPQTLFLILYGVHGYSYRLDMSRSGGPKAS
ncbi:MAG TPA: hypothetical protein PKL14_08120 [Holophaga sp.]|nr:hypothetical protein [Holophaga sp.]